MNVRVGGEGPRPIPRDPNHAYRRAFTMVELLVVIAVIALLLAIVTPAAQRATVWARAVACQSQLRQRGVVCCSVFVRERGWPITNATIDAYDQCWGTYCEGPSNLFVCPMARRYETNTENPSWKSLDSIGCGLGSKFTAWKLPLRTPVSREPGLFLGSYGLNTFGFQHLDARTHSERRVRLSDVPIFLDSASWMAGASSDDMPPAYEGQLGMNDIKDCCIDRHRAAINGLFLDWSVREIGLKELWTLDWSPGFDVRNAWTRAGGVQPEDWPQWMQGFRDY